ncbi:lipoyl(octanoyl) transferase LipB [Calditerricola satsumensis]|nr:lipoyl(octanoyl) transferase LipB [Calditerricola satsumensis]
MICFTEVMAMSPLHVEDWGLMDYEDAWDRQKRLIVELDEGRSPNVLALLEHPHTYTLGRGGTYDHLLASQDELAKRGIRVYEIDRGGDITYHGPEQLVGYPLLLLCGQRADPRRYLRDLEEVLIRALADFGIAAGRKAPYTGVWVGDEKVAAIGVKFTRARRHKGCIITSHGFALNVNTDLRYFNLIIPCGIREYGVTSMEKLLGKRVPMADVKARVVHHFRDVFSGETEGDADKPGKAEGRPAPATES